MNTLTPNRIIQQGDEYFGTDGMWHVVPEGDFGLQVMFTKYKEVRRPSEPEQDGAAGTPAPATPEPLATAQAVTPAPERPESKPDAPPRPLSETYGKKKPKELPTVVSKKAHGVQDDILAEEKRRRIAAEIAATSEVIHGISTKDAIKARKAAELAGRVPSGKIYALDVTYSDLSALPNWIGRNGTFKAQGLRVESRPNGLIQLRPIGQRGLAKNALIEFPKADIPRVVDFLLRHQVKPA